MNDVDNILNRKEFQILKFTPGDKLPIKKLQYAIQQLFTARWMNLGYKKRLFLIHSMGSGKTLASLLAAEENIQLYKLLGGGKLIILGFQKNTFFREMLTRPELGYISQDEFEKIKELEQFQHTEIGQQNYNRYISYLRKRISGAEGYVRFIGYQELYNMLFDDEGVVNNETLELFANSFIICDEFHNVYNSQEANSYGRAINYILEHYENKPEEPKVLFMSGTPINNKPSELIDMLNIILPGREKLKKEEFFTDGEIEKILPGKMNVLRRLMSGYFSFYINENVSLLPRKYYDGEQRGGMKFIVCPLTQAQEKVLKSINYKLNLDDHNIYDAAFDLSFLPAKKDNVKKESKKQEETIIYKTSDFPMIAQQPQQWRTEVGLDYNGETITGHALLEENIKNYSHKYFLMLQEIRRVMQGPQRGKMIIYHEYIKGTGIKLLEQILITNGYLAATGHIADNNICFECGLRFREHKNKTNLNIKSHDSVTNGRHNTSQMESSEHVFEPIRFLSIYGELDKSTIVQNMEIYNAYNNSGGNRYAILLGSEMIREGLNFNCVRSMLVMHQLPHISAFLQLCGRAIRTYSHEMLPPKQRDVHIKIFATEPEIEKYHKKLQNYRLIQELQKTIYEDAVDISFYYDIIKTSFGQDSLGILPFARKTIKKKVIKLDTYHVFYDEWEVREIRKIIESLFTMSPAWTYDDLLKSVRHPPFVQFIDFSQITENNFVLALGDMIYGPTPAIIVKKGVNYKIMAVFGDIGKNKTPIYVIFPTEDVIVMPFGSKIENVHGISTPDYLSWMHSRVPTRNIQYTITDELLNLNTNYEEMKHKFFLKFNKTDVLEIPRSTEIYGIEFHIRLIEEAIPYIFNMLTHRSNHRSEYHEFYFKMIHFYNKIDLIVYANNLPEKYTHLYKDYTSGESDTNTLLISNISNIMSSSVSSFEITEIDKFIEKGKTRVSSNALPVGHLLTTEIQKFVEPKLYTPHGWFLAKDFVITQENYRENDIIVGYYERSENSINFKFKLRQPLHKAEEKRDKREVEKGMVCETIKKTRLEEYAQQLGITLTGTNFTICDEIKKFLLYQELKDRNKFRKGKVPERTRWCYLQFEPHGP